MGAEDLAWRKASLVRELSDGIQGCGLERPGLPSFVQGEQVAAVMDDAGICWIGRHLEEVLSEPTRDLRAKPSMADRLGGGLVQILWRPHVLIFEVDLPFIKREGRNHAVAVKPMPIFCIANTLAAGPIPKEGAFKIGGYISFNRINDVVELLVQVFESTVTRRKFIDTQSLSHIRLH